MKICCKAILFSIILLLSVISSCVKDGIESCASQSIHVRFYSKTICDTDTLYPSAIQNIWIGLFDEEDILIAHTNTGQVTLSKDYYYELSANTGTYTIIAWTGINDELADIQPLQDGITKKNDLYFRLRRMQELVYSLDGEQFFYGESPVFYVDQNRSTEPLIINTSVNLLELTNRITVTVNGLLETEGIDMIILSDNGSVNIDGSNARDELIEYHPVYDTGEKSVSAFFTLLNLDANLTNTLIITDTDQNTEIFDGDLLNEILLQNPEINTECDHDFFITINLDNQDTYVLLEIWVNNWLVHSYNKEM